MDKYIGTFLFSFFVICACCITDATFARNHYKDAVLQKRKGQHEVAVSAGVISGRQIGYYFSGEHGDMMYNSTPSYFASYKYYVFNFMAVGLTYGTQTLWARNSSEYIGPAYTIKDINNTLALEVTFAYPYGKNGFVRPYAILGFGYSQCQTTYSYSSGTTSNESNTHTNFQITPIGVRIGGAFAGFVEFGAGYKGLLNGGFLYDFGWNKQKNIR
jgi:hypothetical protein